MKASVLDSFSLLAYLERETGHDEMAKLFEESVNKNRAVFLTVINWGEVLLHAQRSGGQEMAKRAEEAIRALPIVIVEVDTDLAREAAGLKATARISMADAFAAALALRKKCELVTGDREVRQIESKLKLRWIR